MSAGGTLERIVERLRIAGIPHMLAGSFASTYHGTPRTTQDIDLVIDPTPEALERFVAALPPDQFYVSFDAARHALAGRTQFNVIDVATGWVLADEYPDHGALAPPSVGGTPVRLRLYVDDVDAVVARALGAGATLARPVQDELYGERTGQIVDPFGHLWILSTRTEALSAREVERRFGELMSR